jgi:hypothetical protein
MCVLLVTATVPCTINLILLGPFLRCRLNHRVSIKLSKKVLNRNEFGWQRRGVPELAIVYELVCPIPIP